MGHFTSLFCFLHSLGRLSVEWLRIFLDLAPIEEDGKGEPEEDTDHSEQQRIEQGTHLDNI